MNTTEETPLPIGEIETGIPIPPDRRTLRSKLAEMNIHDSILVKRSRMPQIYTIFKTWKWSLVSRGVARNGPQADYVRVWRTK